MNIKKVYKATSMALLALILLLVGVGFWEALEANSERYKGVCTTPRLKTDHYEVIAKFRRYYCEKLVVMFPVPILENCVKVETLRMFTPRECPKMERGQPTPLTTFREYKEIRADHVDHIWDIGQPLRCLK